MKTKKFRLGFVCFFLCASFCLAAALPAFASSGTITCPTGFYGAATFGLMPGDTQDIYLNITNREAKAISLYVKFLDPSGTELYRTDTYNVPANGAWAMSTTAFLNKQGLGANNFITPVIVWSGQRIII